MVKSVSVNTRNVTLNIFSGTGTINLATDAVDKSIQIGSSSITTPLGISTGNGTINIGSNATSKAINIGNTTGSNTVDIRSGTGSVNIGTSVSKTITIGNSSINTSNFMTLRSGTGNIDIGTSVAKTITIGNTTGSTSMSISAGTGGVSIGTSVAKTITIGNNTGATRVVLATGTGGIRWSAIDQTGTSFTFVPGINYSANNGSLVTGTLPTTAAIGAIFSIQGYGAGGWTIAQNSGQTIYSTATSTTTGTGGSLSSGGQYDAVTLVCAVADTDFVIVDFVGTLNFV